MKVQEEATEEPPTMSQEKRQAFLSLVQERGTGNHLVNSTPAVWSDKECVLAVVKTCGCALKIAADILKADKEIVPLDIHDMAPAIQSSEYSLVAEGAPQLSPRHRGGGGAARGDASRREQRSTHYSLNTDAPWGDVIVATNLCGRGMDIRMPEGQIRGPLLINVMAMSSSTRDQQFMGRTARRGNGADWPTGRTSHPGQFSTDAIELVMSQAACSAAEATRALAQYGEIYTSIVALPRMSCRRRGL